MTTTREPVGVTMTTTSCRTLYWTVSTDVSLTATPQVTVVPPGDEPDVNTVWHDAAWEGAETIDGDTHTRTLSALVAGPDGPTNGAPYVVAAGEWDTFWGISTTTERVEVRGDMLVIE